MEPYVRPKSRLTEFFISKLAYDALDQQENFTLSYSSIMCENLKFQPRKFSIAQKLFDKVGVSCALNIK